MTFDHPLCTATDVLVSIVLPSLTKRVFFIASLAVSDTAIPEDVGYVGLLDRRVVDVLMKLSESDRYFPGLRSWVGFQQTGIPIERDARYDEKTRVSLVGLFRLAKTAMFSFSSFPLTMFSIIAMLSALRRLDLLHGTRYSRGWLFPDGLR